MATASLKLFVLSRRGGGAWEGGNNRHHWCKWALQGFGSLLN
jgi:hypothetical protein